MLRKFILSGGLAVIMTAIAPSAHAGLIFFNVPGLHPGESARVGEQIVCANPGCTVLDYQFYVLNTGIVGIDGVAFGLGVVNAAAQIAGGMTTVATAGGGGDGPFPAQPFGGVANGGTGVLGPCGPAACNPRALGPAPWAFKEFQDAGTGGGLPATFSIVRWYSPIQGLLGAKLLPNRYTRLDLFTVYPPAGGNGAVDPPDETQPSSALTTSAATLASTRIPSSIPLRISVPGLRFAIPRRPLAERRQRVPLPIRNSRRQHLICHKRRNPRLSSLSEPG